MIYAKSCTAYVAILLSISVSRPEAFIPSSGGAVSLTARGSSATNWSSRTPAGAAAAATTATRCRSRRSRPCMSTSDDHDILLRVAKGEKADRSPVWLMRQVKSGMLVVCYLQAVPLSSFLFCQRRKGQRPASDHSTRCCMIQHCDTRVLCIALRCAAAVLTTRSVPFDTCLAGYKSSTVYTSNNNNVVVRDI